MFLPMLWKIVEVTMILKFGKPSNETTHIYFETFRKTTIKRDEIHYKRKINSIASVWF